MESKLIVAIILLITGLLGIGLIMQPTTKSFMSEQSEDIYQKKFEEFQWKYEKVYNDEVEEAKRFLLFKKALIYIEEFNAKSKDVKLAMNKFGDLTDSEFSQYLSRQLAPSKKVYSTKKIINRPAKVDWVGVLANKEVYDQGSCGSCWAFSAVQALEGAYAKATGTFRKLSVSELVDCVYPSRDICSKGGEEREGMEWVIDNGICAEEDYPRKYDETQKKCQKDKCTPLLKKIEKVIYIPPKDAQGTLNHVAIAPVTVAINASLYVFRYYASGIIKDNPSSSLNHAVIAIGYDESENFLKVKNSWGEDWGESGYFRVDVSSSGPGPLGVYLEACYPHYENEPVPTF